MDRDGTTGDGLSQGELAEAYAEFKLGARQLVPMTPDLAREYYAGFYGNEAIRSIAGTDAWSISTSDKMPVNMGALEQGRISGASPNREGDAVTLDHLTETWPDAANAAYRIEGLDDDLVVVDVEATATEETRRRMLALPWLYAEVSMSGKGLHLILPYPRELIDTYPDAFGMSVYKSPDRTWEVLVSDHWVTFTRFALPNARPGTASFEDVLRPIVAKARRVPDVGDFGELPDASDVPWFEYVKNCVDGPLSTSLETCEFDDSSYDWRACLEMSRRIVGRLQLMAPFKDSATVEDVTAAVVSILSDDDYDLKREKWWKHRVNGLPYIVHTAAKAVNSVLRSYGLDKDGAGDAK